MKIGFDISQTGAGKAGCGFLADSLIQHIARQDHNNHYDLYRTFGDQFWDLKAHETRKIDQANFHYGVQHSSIEQAGAFWQQSAQKILSALGFPNIIHSNNYFTPSIKLAQTKYIYTLYDLSYIEHPEWTTEANRTVCFNGTFNASIYADYIIAISEYTRQHFLTVFPHYPTERISVVYPASRYEQISEIKQPKRLAHLKQQQFWLNVGTLEPRKNQKRLLEAYAQLKIENKCHYPLVLAGGNGWMMEDFKGLITDLRLEDDVILLGYVTDQELQWLYQQCFCLVYPSLFEGFGLPVLEAMSLGACVITSSTSSLPEIVGDSGIMVDPFSVDAIFAAMHLLLNDHSLAETLRSKGIERAKCFSWESAAAATLKIYNFL
jgi:glycosyltransferase involved in cell wall biosynthesis